MYISSAAYSASIYQGNLPIGMVRRCLLVTCLFVLIQISIEEVTKSDKPHDNDKATNNDNDESSEESWDEDEKPAEESEHNKDNNAEHDNYNDQSAVKNNGHDDNGKQDSHPMEEHEEKQEKSAVKNKDHDEKDNPDSYHTEEHEENIDKNGPKNIKHGDKDKQDSHANDSPAKETKTNKNNTAQHDDLNDKGTAKNKGHDGKGKQDSHATTQHDEKQEERVKHGEDAGDKPKEEADSEFSVKGTPIRELSQTPSWPPVRAKQAIGEQIGGVAVDKHNNVFVFHRADRKWEYGIFEKIQYPTIYGIAANTSKPLDKFTLTSQNRFMMPHGVTVDSEGNLWVTDVFLNQVFKFSPDGTIDPVLKLGTKGREGSDDHHFCKPTAVAVSSNGEFFVADGYCNSRILKYAESGKLMGSWGTTGSGESEFNVPHGLALIESEDLICVADRENKRVQCFTAGLSEKDKSFGVLVMTIKGGSFGRVFGIAYDKAGNNLLILGSAEQSRNGRYRKQEVHIFNLNKKKVIRKVSENGPQRDFEAGHTIAACPDGSCFVVGGLKRVCDAVNHYECLGPRGLRYMTNLWKFDLKH